MTHAIIVAQDRLLEVIRAASDIAPDRDEGGLDALAQYIDQLQTAVDLNMQNGLATDDLDVLKVMLAASELLGALEQLIRAVESKTKQTSRAPNPP
jgi:hypothetical protein